ncbi:hypothetical protein HYV57_05035 [Candidatus Peregrinibacteria bacterium]|nr:hypothetical protein [Candidatus Peregrinibacteria bacterium]
MVDRPEGRRIDSEPGSDAGLEFSCVSGDEIPDESHSSPAVFFLEEFRQYPKIVNAVRDKIIFGCDYSS